MKKVSLVFVGALLFCIILVASSSFKSAKSDEKISPEIYITKCSENNSAHIRNCPNHLKTGPTTGELFLRKIPRNNRKMVA
jgi:hypothetical protein